MKKIISCILVIVITSFFCILPVNAENSSSTPNTQMETDISVQGTNAFGNLLTNELTAEMDKQEENNGCNIFSIEMNGTEATVSLETTEDCTLVVAVYNEYDNEKMLASGSTTVAKGETETFVTIDTDNMPQYYYLCGFLVDSDTLRPLCTAYESPNYTQEMQEFFLKTVNDFDSEKVLNLDNDESNNFAVFSDETIIVEQSGAVNRVIRADDDTRTYVIVNADSTVKSLKNGDIFTCKNGDETLIVKVDKISANGSSVTVKGQNTSMEDVFDYVKIDASQDIGQATVDTSNLPNGVIYNGTNDSLVRQQPLPSLNRPLMRAVEGEGKLEKSHSFSFESPESESGNIKFNVSGGISFKNDVTLKFYFSLNHYYVELKFDNESEIGIKVKGSTNKCDIKLAEFNYPIAPGVNISLIPRFVVRVSGEVELSGKLTDTVGFRISNDEGLRNISSQPHFESELRAEATVFIGFILEPNINLINSNIAKIGMEAEVGAEIKVSENLFELGTQKHTCYECLDGDISAKWSLAFTAQLLNWDSLKFEYKAYDMTLKLLDFYYSVDKNKFGWGECPYMKYCINVRAIDSDGNLVSGASINSGDIYLGTTDDTGNAEVYLSNGEYVLTVKKDNIKASRNITVHNNDKKIVMKLKELGASTDSDEDDINFSGGSQIIHREKFSAAITEDGQLYTWGRNADGQLGNGTKEDSLIPIKIMDNVKSVSLSDVHSAAITEDNVLYMWGYNYSGQLGIGTTERYSLTPVKVMDNVESISLSNSHSAAITEDGSLYMWGNNSTCQCGNWTKESSNIPIKVMDNVKSVFLENGYSAVITKDRSLYMFGCNYAGQLGIGKRNYCVEYPIKIMDNVKSVYLRNNTGAAITEDSSLYMWGDNNHGKLGNGTKEDSLIPIKIMDNVKSVSLSDFHSAAITKDNMLYMWGLNNYGQIGNGESGYNKNILTPIKIIDNVKSISLENFYSGAITEDGSLYMWGNNSSGQLGNGTQKSSNIPIKIMDNVKSVSLKYLISSAITQDESLYMWGNDYGRLGSGTKEELYVLTPIRIEIPPSNSNTATLNLNQEYAIMADEQDSLADYSVTSDLKQSPKILANEKYAVWNACRLYDNLIPNETYNFYVMKSEDVENPLSSDNLLYITQAVSNANGSLVISYTTKENYKDEKSIVKSALKTDLSSAKVTIPDILCDGTEKFAEPKVILDGDTLTEGVDYDIEKRYSAIYPGEYELIITGIRNYTGEVAANYNVYCNHSFSNSKCNICKSVKDSVGDANGDGVVGVADLIALQNFLLTKRKDISINADINQDKVIDIFDLCLLRKIVSQHLMT